MANVMRFTDVLVMLWRGRGSLASCVIAATVLGVIISLLLPLRYEAKVLFMAAENAEMRGGLGALGGRLSDLADLAGFAGGAAGNSEKALAVLSSRGFTDRFLREDGVKQALFAEDWDEGEGQWKLSGDSWFSAWRGSFEGFFHRGATQAGAQTRDEEVGPSSWDAYRKFNRIRSVTRDRRTGVITLSITWRDPHLAAQWANRLVDQVNEELRARAIKEAELSQQYLSDQLEKTNPLELRDVLFRLSESEQRKGMLAHVRRDFAFEIVDPAVAPKERVSPKRTVFVISAAFVGFLVGVILVTTRNLLRPHDSVG